MAVRAEIGWQSEMTLVECMHHMLDNEIATDVCFEVGPPGGATVKIQAHKYMLISRSPVFEAMFSSGMAECSGPVSTIRVEDIDAFIFKELLMYIYCESISLSPESAMYLMYAARKYMLPRLVRECGKCLSDSLNVDNVILILEHSLHLDDQQLQSKCLQLISKNSKTVLTAAGITSVSRQVLEAILEANAVPISESVMYEISINWAKHQLQGENPTDLQIREALGELLYKIRFPTMKPIDFAEISAGNNILTAEEKESIYYFLATKKAGSHLKFTTEKRIGEEVWIDRTGNCVTTQWHSAPHVDAIDFTTDHDILLTGIGLYTGYNGLGYDVDIEILESTNSLFKKKVSIPYTGNTEPFKILLDEPIFLPVGVTYTVKALSNNSIGHYSQACQPVCTKEAVTFLFSRYRDSPSTNENSGQIPRLYFCSL